jgi:alpha-mannosidase
MTGMTKPTYHVVSHSHWDREWYFPFDRFRAMLVDMVEDLIELFDKDPAFTSYTLDGQMAAVMDYLETRPDRAETIHTLVQNRKLFIGPWYILNDEFLSSGESHIRNLSLGFRLGKTLGGVMAAGYIPDQFGHIAQMPQILKGFGIEAALIYRGFGGEAGQEKSEYWWSGPDGTRVLMHHLPKDGYSAGYFGTKDNDVIIQKFDRLKKELDARATTSQRLFFNGGDHHWPDSAVTNAIAVLRKHYDADIRHSNFPDFLAAVRSEIGTGSTLPTLHGETRFGYRHAFAVLGGVFSSRMYLKQLNAECETLLERILEPLNVIAVQSGMRSKTPQIEQAWKYVLQNQDHDAICGTSVDDVHREMVVRYGKAKQIGEHVKAECFAGILPYDEREHKDERFVFVFNPSPWERSGLVETEVEFYLQDIVVGLNPEVRVADKVPPVQGFKLFDPSGKEVPYQVVGREEAFGVTYSKQDYPHQTLVDRFSVVIDAHAIPALGWRGLRISKTNDMPRFSAGVTTGYRSIENEFLRLEVNAGGVVTMTDKLSSLVYENINFFEDSGDVGDEYNYSYPEKDGWFSSSQFVPRVTVAETGPLRASLKIEHRMAAPKEAAQDAKSRSVEMAEILVETVFSLSPSVRRVDIKTTVHNVCKDHRFRALFSTGIDTVESYADTPFAVVHRTHQTYDTTQFPFEHPALVAPMQRFVTIADASKGLTLIVKGLPEYELKLDKRGELALTLLRCVGKLSGRDLITRPGGAAGWWNETPDAQCLGTHTFEYSVVPHTTLDENVWASILEQVEEFTVPMTSVKRKNEQHVFESEFLDVEPKSLLLTGLKRSDDNSGIIVRLNNPIDHEIRGVIHFAAQVKTAYRAMMNEDILNPVEIRGEHEVPITVKAFEVITLLVQL